MPRRVSSSAAACISRPTSQWPGVVAERHRRAVRGAHAAQRAEDQEFFGQQALRLPAHGGILREAKNLAAGRLAQPIGRQRQAALRTGGVGGNRVQAGVG